MVYRVSKEELDYGATSGDNNTDPGKEKVLDEVQGQDHIEENVDTTAEELKYDLKQARDSVDDLDSMKEDIEKTEELSEESFHEMRDRLASIRVVNGFGTDRQTIFSVESMPTDRKIAMLSGIQDTRDALVESIAKAEKYLLKHE